MPSSTPPPPWAQTCVDHSRGLLKSLLHGRLEKPAGFGCQRCPVRMFRDKDTPTSPGPPTVTHHDGLPEVLIKSTGLYKGQIHSMEGGL